MKGSVIERLCHAQRWCRDHGPAYEWLGTLLRDAAQELQSESGGLWCQWMTGPAGHVRMFVAGEFGPDELDAFMEMLKLSRSYMEKHREQPEADAAVDPQTTSTGTPTTREKGF